MSRYDIFVEQNGYKWCVETVDCVETARHLVDTFYEHIYDEVKIIDNSVLKG
jgi:hypothetical protein